jgi:hypothetical protein
LPIFLGIIFVPLTINKIDKIYQNNGKNLFSTCVHVFGSNITEDAEPKNNKSGLS